MTAAGITWLASADDVFRVGRDGDRYVAEWRGLGTLSADRASGEHAFAFSDGAPEDVRDKIREGSGALLVRHLRGGMGLHAAAVARGDRAIVVLGRSGDGKSTLARALVDAHGFALLADDAVALEGGLALPTERRVWVEDGREDGKRAREMRLATSPARPIAFVSLAFADEPVSLVARSPRAALADLVASYVRFALDDRALLRLEAERIAGLAETATFLTLTRPRDPARIAETARAVADLVP